MYFQLEDFEKADDEEMASTASEKRVETGTHLSLEETCRLYSQMSILSHGKGQRTPHYESLLTEWSSNQARLKHNLAPLLAAVHQDPPLSILLVGGLFPLLC